MTRRNCALRAHAVGGVGEAVRAWALLAGVGLVAVATIAAGCGKQKFLPGPDVFARVDGVEVRYGELERYLQLNLGESGGALASEALSSLLDQFLTERLLAKWAVERGLAKPGDSAATAVDALLAAEPVAPVTETAISAYYQEHQGEFRVPEQLDLLVIRTDDRVVAERARREIAAGADFGAVARRLSIDPTAEAGGEQGTIDRESLPPALGDALFRLSEGSLSEIVAGTDGFQLFRVVRRIPERVRSLSEAREEILQKLAGARADRAYGRLVAEARSRYALEVYDRNLPFAYKGAFPVSRPYENR